MDMTQNSINGSNNPDDMPVAEANAMTSMPTGQNRACNNMVIETNDVLKELDGQEPEIEATWQPTLSRADCSTDGLELGNGAQDAAETGSGMLEHNSDLDVKDMYNQLAVKFSPEMNTMHEDKIRDLEEKRKKSAKEETRGQ
jgi:hypothetical protein